MFPTTRSAIGAGLLAGLLLMVLALPYLPGALEAPRLGGAVLIDLMLVLPVLAWLAGRAGIGPRIGLAAAFGICALAGLFALPDPVQERLRALLITLLPWMEVALVAALGWRLWSFSRAGAGDLYSASQETAAGFLGQGAAGRLVGSELAMLAYLVAPKRPLAPGSFAVHGASGFKPILWALMMLGLLELVVVHVLLHLVSPVAAWILTGLSLLGLLFLLAHLRALARRAHGIEGEELVLRNGLFGTARIPLEAIASAGRAPTDQEGLHRFAALGPVEPMSVLLRLDRPVRYHVTHGMTRETDHLLLPVDDVAGFLAALQGRRGDSAARD